MRLLASLQHYLATTDAEGLQVHQYATSDLDAGDGGPAVRIRTEYPWDGRIEVEVLDGPDGSWTLSLRVPGWCAEGRLAVAGGKATPVQPGYARVHRTWRPGDRLVLELPMAPRFLAPHPRIDAVRDSVAIERGPLVYCVEAADMPDRIPVDDLAVDPAEPLREVRRPELLGGVVAIETRARHAAPNSWPRDWPYVPVGAMPAAADGGDDVPLVAVPYFAWGNRGDGAMRIWLKAR
jgi:DUF1680 family protein